MDQIYMFFICLPIPKNSSHTLQGGKLRLLFWARYSNNGSRYGHVESPTENAIIGSVKGHRFLYYFINPVERLIDWKPPSEQTGTLQTLLEFIKFMI